MSFIDKLKTLGIKKQEGQETIAINQGKPPLQEEVGEMEEIIQLDVDIYQTPYELIIYALVPGVSSKDLDIFLEDQGDVLTIKGTRKRPENQFSENDDKEAKKQSKWLLEECHWGSFYRRILLSQEVNAAEIEAKLKNGVLILRLPLLKIKAGKRKINILEEK